MYRAQASMLDASHRMCALLMLHCQFGHLYKNFMWVHGFHVQPDWFASVCICLADYSW